MDNHLNHLIQVARSGELAIITGSTCSEENPWKVLTNEILSFLENLEPTWKPYVKEIRQRAVPTEAFYRLCHQHFGEEIFSLWKCFSYEKPGRIQRQLASLVKCGATSRLATAAIDNRLRLALQEQNVAHSPAPDSSEAPVVVFLNGEITEAESLKDNLGTNDSNFVALRNAADVFFRNLKRVKAVLVLGFDPGEYCWKMSYGKLLNLARAGIPVYWVAPQQSLQLAHVTAIAQGAILAERPENILNEILKARGCDTIAAEEQPQRDFSYVADWVNSKTNPTQWLYFLALVLKFAVSRSHAYALFEQVVGASQQAKDNRQLALCHRHMGQILFEQGYLNKSLDFHNKAMVFWGKTSDEKDMADEHMLLGSTYWNGSLLEKAVQHYGEALSIYRKQRIAKDTCDVASKLAFICDEDGDYELSKRYYSESLQAAKKLNNPGLEIITLLNFSTSLIKDKNWELAKQYLEEAMALSERELENFYQGEIFQHLGLVYTNMENFSTARLFYEKAYQYYKKYEEKLSLTFVYCNLGHVCVRLEDYDAAVEYYEGAIESYEKMGDWQHLAAVYNNLGFVNSNRQNYHLAEEYFARAAEIFAALGDVYNLIRTHSNLGRVYAIQGEVDNACECYKANIEMLAQLNEQEDLAATYVSLAMVQLQSKQYKDALANLDSAVEIYGTLGQNQEKEDTRKIIETIKSSILPSSG